MLILVFRGALYTSSIIVKTKIAMITTVK